MDRSGGAEPGSAAATAPEVRTLAARLLDAAEEEIVRTGSTEISLRAVARSAGVSHQAPGFVFKDRAGLLAALAARGFETLYREIIAARDALPPDASAREVLAEMGVAYILATARRPALASLIARTDLGTSNPELENARADAFETLYAVVRQAMAEGWHPDHSEAEIAVLFWAAVHGLSVIPPEARQRFTPGSLEETARSVMAILVRD